MSGTPPPLPYSGALFQHKVGTGHLHGTSLGSGVPGTSPAFAVDGLSGESRYRLALGKVIGYLVR